MFRYWVFGDAYEPLFVSQRYFVAWIYAKLRCAQAHHCRIEDSIKQEVVAQWCQGARLAAAQKIARPEERDFVVTLVDGEVREVSAESEHMARMIVVYGGRSEIPVDTATGAPQQRFVKVHPDNIKSITLKGGGVVEE
jgi:predicted methyltransferase